MAKASPRTPTVPDRPPCRLYLITPPIIPDLDAFAAVLDQALAFLQTHTAAAQV